MRLDPCFASLFANRKNAKVPQIETAIAVVRLCLEISAKNPYKPKVELNVLDVINRYHNKPYNRYNAQISRVFEIMSNNGYACEYGCIYKQYPYVSATMKVDIQRIKSIVN